LKIEDRYRHFQEVLLASCIFRGELSKKAVALGKGAYKGFETLVTNNFSPGPSWTDAGKLLINVGSNPVLRGGFTMGVGIVAGICLGPEAVPAAMTVANYAYLGMVGVGVACIARGNVVEPAIAFQDEYQYQMSKIISNV
jgi:hypothetical protein